MSEQNDIWDKKPLRFSTAGLEGQGAYHAGNMDAWLEKVKAELVRSNQEGLEHYAIAVEYYEKLEAIKTHFKFFPVSIKNISQWIKQGRKILEGGT